ncbi:MAG: O-antigen translocase [Methylococcaceae bacterium]|nr:O-antigen translocase [Methylococcaceae bacterium]
MAEESASHRQILKATSITGLSSVMTILLGILRTKVLAVLLGPAGVGLSGMYISIMGTAGTLVGFGLGSSGVRQIAEAIGRGDEHAVGIVRSVLWYANLICGVLGCLLLWGVRESVSQWLFGDTSEATSIAWLGVGLLLGSVAGSQTALLQGFRHIGDLARVNVISSVIGSLFAVGFVYTLGRDGVVWFVLVNPAVSVLIAARYAARLPRVTHSPTWAETGREAYTLFGLGVVFMSTGLMQSGVQLAVRTLVTREVGVEAVGQFQAAWSISMQYIGFVLGAMAADYYPRLTAAIHDREQANRMVNQQAEVALLLTGPILLGMLTFSPIVIDILYSSSFAPAADILRWQVMGDLVKIFSWPVGFVLLASGDGRIFFFMELIWNVCYLGIVYFGLPIMGLSVTGLGFLFAYITYYVLIYSFVNQTFRFCWSARNHRLIVGLSTVMALLQLLANAPQVIDVANSIMSKLRTSTVATHIAENFKTNMVTALDNVFIVQSHEMIDEIAQPLAYVVGTALTLTIAIYSACRMKSLLNLSAWLRRKL